MQLATQIMITVWLSWMIVANFVRYVRLDTQYRGMNPGPEKARTNTALDRLAAVSAIDLGANALLIVFLWMFL